MFSFSSSFFLKFFCALWHTRHITSSSLDFFCFEKKLNTATLRHALNYWRRILQTNSTQGIVWQVLKYFIKKMLRHTFNNWRRILQTNGTQGIVWQYLSTTSSTSTRPPIPETKKKHVAWSQSWTCRICSLQLPSNYQIDHISPIALGGHSGLQNLQALCKQCHALKTQQDLAAIADAKRTTSHVPSWVHMMNVTPPLDTTTTTTTLQELELTHLNERQRSAVLHQGAAPVRVVAGPGTGKTAVLTSRVAALVSRFHVAPTNILTLTFTNRASREMRSRIVDLVGSPAVAEQISMGTFHATCLSMLRSTIHLVPVRPTPIVSTTRMEEMADVEEMEEMEEVEVEDLPQSDSLVYPYRRGFGVYDETETLKVVRDILRKQLGYSVEEAQPSEFQSLISSAKNSGIYEASTYMKSKHARRDVARVFVLYEKILRERNQIDFDDMLWLSVRLMEKNTHVLQKCQAMWRHVLVDEFQDTNGTQFEFLRLLGTDNSDTTDNSDATDNSDVLGTTEMTMPPSTLFVVGDSDQAIYGFRGADHLNQKKYDNYFQPVVYHLDRNYRSIQPVLNCAHRLISSNERPVEASTEPLVGLEHESKSPVVVCRLEDEIEEARWIVDECIRIKEAEERERERRRNVDDSSSSSSSSSSDGLEIAILMRTNAQFRVIERQLLRQGVEHVRS